MADDDRDPSIFAPQSLLQQQQQPPPGGDPTIFDPVGHFAREKARSGASFEDVRPVLERNGLNPKAAEQSYKLEAARGKAETMDEPGWLEAVRKSIPGASAVGSFLLERQYKESRDRIAAGQGRDAAWEGAKHSDYDFVAQYERMQQLDQQRSQGLLGGLREAAVRAPAILGEAYATGGASVGPRAGAGALERLGVFAANRAAVTPLQPSLYLAETAKRATEQGGEPYDLKNAAPPLAMAALQNLVLGSVAKLGGAQTLPTRAGRSAVAGIAGVGEQAGADVAGGVWDEVAADSYKTKTRYGVLGDLARGEPDKAATHAAVQALTFASFSALHGKEVNPAETIGPALDSLAKKGMSKEAAAKAVNDAVAAATAEKPAEPNAETATQPAEAPEAYKPNAVKGAPTDAFGIDPESALKALPDSYEQAFRQNVDTAIKSGTMTGFVDAQGQTDLHRLAAYRGILREKGYDLGPGVVDRRAGVVSFPVVKSAAKSPPAITPEVAKHAEAMKEALFRVPDYKASGEGVSAAIKELVGPFAGKWTSKGAEQNEPYFTSGKVQFEFDPKGFQPGEMTDSGREAQIGSQTPMYEHPGLKSIRFKGPETDAGFAKLKGLVEDANQMREQAGIEPIKLEATEKAKGEKPADTLAGIPEGDQKALAKQLGLSVKALREKADRPGIRQLLDTVRGKPTEEPTPKGEFVGGKEIALPGPHAHDPGLAPFIGQLRQDGYSERQLASMSAEQIKTSAFVMKMQRAEMERQITHDPQTEAEMSQGAEPILHARLADEVRAHAESTQFVPPEGKPDWKVGRSSDPRLLARQVSEILAWAKSEGLTRAEAAEAVRQEVAEGKVRNVHGVWMADVASELERGPGGKRSNSTEPRTEEAPKSTIAPESPQAQPDSGSAQTPAEGEIVAVRASNAKESAPLTDQERHVLDQTRAGRTLREIAKDKELNGLSHETVRTRLRKALEKSGLTPADVEAELANQRARSAVASVERSGPGGVIAADVKGNEGEVLRQVRVRRTDLEKRQKALDDLGTQYLKEFEDAGPDGLSPERKAFFEAEAARLHQPAEGRPVAANQPPEGVRANPAPRPGGRPTVPAPGDAGGVPQAQPEVGAGRGGGAGPADVTFEPFPGGPRDVGAAEQRTVNPAFPAPPPTEGGFRGGIPGIPGMTVGTGGLPGRPPSEFAMARSEVTKEREARGREAVAAAVRRSNPQAWAAAEARLHADPQAGEKLVDSLAAEPRPITSDEGALLLQRRIALSNAHDAALVEYLRVRGSKVNENGVLRDATEAEVEPYRRAVQDAEAARDKLDAVTAAAGTQLGRGLQFFAQLAREDYTLGSMLRRAAAAKGEPLTKEEEETVTRQHEEIEKASERLGRHESGAEPAAKAGEKGDVTDLRVNEQKARQAFQQTITGLQAAARPLHRKVISGVGEAANVVRTFITAYDLSAVLRQGAMLTYAHPLKAAKAFPDMMRAFFDAHQFARAEDLIRHRPNAALYKQGELYLADHLSAPEEAFLGKWVKRVPGVAASERAYTSFLNRVRADVFDSMVASLPREAKPTVPELKAIGNYVNVATGRGGLGAAEKAATALSHVFFSPRYLASRVQVLAGQPFYGGTARTRKLIAQEYARSLAGLGVFYAVSSLLMPDSELSFDPRSSDFGKLKMGRFRVDPLAGFSQLATLGARLVSGETKSTETGKVTALGGPQHKFGEPDTGDVVMRFLRNKLAPVPGVVYDVLARERGGGRPTDAEHLAGSVVPISVKDVYEAMTSGQGVPRSTALALLAILGMGTQNYEPRQKATGQPILPVFPSRDLRRQPALAR